MIRRAFFSSWLGFALGVVVMLVLPCSRPVRQTVPAARYWVVLDGAPACVDLGAVWLSEEE